MAERGGSGSARESCGDFSVAVRAQRPHGLFSVRDLEPRTSTSNFTHLLSSSIMW